jgi:hypothetical protein
MGHTWREGLAPQQDSLLEATGAPYSVLIETPPEGWDYLVRLSGGRVVPVKANEVLCRLFTTGSSTGRKS